MFGHHAGSLGLLLHVCSRNAQRRVCGRPNRPGQIKRLEQVIPVRVSIHANVLVFRLGPDTRLIVTETRVTGMERVTFGICRALMENTNFLLLSEMYFGSLGSIERSHTSFAT